MTWTLLRPTLDSVLPSSRFGHCLVSDGSRLYVHGGVDSSGKLENSLTLKKFKLAFEKIICNNFDAVPSGNVRSDIFSYSIESMQWKDISSKLGGAVPSARWGHRCATSGHRIFLYGGQSSRAGGEQQSIVSHFRWIFLLPF